MWPNETGEYRDARHALLNKEIQLRALNEEVAEMRRALPRGGLVDEDYAFVRVSDNRSVMMSELFENGKDTLLTYSMMHAPGSKPCSMCSAFLDGLEATVRHLLQHINVAVIGKAPVVELAVLSSSRKWQALRLYSSSGTSFNRDYRAEDENGNQLPIIHVWRKIGDKVYHFWASELFFNPDPDWPHHPRHADPAWALWNILDLTPQGRGNWFPSLQYDEE